GNCQSSDWLLGHPARKTPPFRRSPRSEESLFDPCVSAPIQLLLLDLSHLHRLSTLCRLPRRIHYFRHNDVYLQRRLPRRLQSLQHHRPQIFQLIIRRWHQCRCLLRLCRRIPGLSYGQRVSSHRNHFARLPINLHVALPKRPIPRPLHNSHRFRVGQNNCRVIIHLWIHIRLDPQRYRRHGQRPLASHQPRHEIHAITSKVVQRSAAIQLRIGQPSQEFRTHANFLRPAMPVVRHHLPHFSNRSFLYHVISARPAWLPSGEIIHQHGNLCRRRGLRHRVGILRAHRQRLLHHHRHPMLRAHFHHLPVIERICVRQNRLRFRRGNHLVQIGVIQLRIQPKLLRVLIEQRPIRLLHAHNLHIRPLYCSRQKSPRMTMHQPRNRNTQRACRSFIQRHLARRRHRRPRRLRLAPRPHTRTNRAHKHHHHDNHARPSHHLYPPSCNKHPSRS